MKMPNLPTIGSPMTLLKHSEKFLSANAPTVLTAVGVAGVVGTAVLTAKATFKAAEVLRTAKLDKLAMQGEHFVVTDPKQVDDLVSPKERALLVWKLYAPAVAVGALSCGAIIGSNRISAKRLAAMAAIASISERNFEEYKAKAKDTLGINKEEKMRGEIAQDRVTTNLAARDTIIHTGQGDQLCFDMYTGRWFYASVEAIKKAQNDINYYMLNPSHNNASVSDFYEKLGLPITSFSDYVGWNSDTQMETHIDSTLSDDNMAVITMDFKTMPFHGYGTNG